MIDKEYANAYREIIEILKYIPKEEYDKIPKNKIKLYEENSNKEYDFKYNPSKTLDEQNVSEITKGIIALLFRDYWATERQRNKILKRQKQLTMQIEKEKRKKYNPNVF